MGQFKGTQLAVKHAMKKALYRATLGQGEQRQVSRSLSEEGLTAEEPTRAMHHTVLRTGHTWEPGMLPGRRDNPRDSSARSMGEEWAVKTGDGGEGQKSGHTSQSSPAGGLKSWNGVSP